MGKNSKILLLSLSILIISFIFIIKSDNLSSWILFYLFATIFIVLLFRQIDKWNIFQKSPFRSYDETNQYFSANGIFKFSKKGFFINENEINDFIEWEDINKIIFYDVTFYESTITFIEIYTDKKRYKFNDDVVGWYQLISNINKNLLDIDNDWNVKNITPIFSDKRTIIYEKVIDKNDNNV